MAQNVDLLLQFHVCGCHVSMLYAELDADLVGAGVMTW